MKILTKYFGEHDISQEDLLQFPNGLPGFIDEKRFILQPFGEAFFILQSVSHTSVAFVTTSPFFFFKDYSLDLPDHLVKQLKIESEQDVAVLVIMSVHKPFSHSTANLKAPVIINQKAHLGKQFIFDDSPYQTRHPLPPASVSPLKKDVK